MRRKTYEKNRSYSSSVSFVNKRRKKTMSKLEPKAVFIQSGKAVGTVIGKKFIKKLDSRKHFLKVPPAIAFDVSSIKKAERYGATILSVFDTYKKVFYTAQIKSLQENGININRGFGSQIALPLQFWKKESVDELNQMELLSATSK